MKKWMKNKTKNEEKKLSAFFPIQAYSACTQDLKHKNVVKYVCMCVYSYVEH